MGCAESNGKRAQGREVLAVRESGNRTPCEALRGQPMRKTLVFHSCTGQVPSWVTWDQFLSIASEGGVGKTTMMFMLAIC